MLASSGWANSRRTSEGSSARRNEVKTVFNISIGEPEGKRPVRLSQLEPGDTFRYAESPLDEAMETGAVYRVIFDPRTKDGQVAILPLDCKGGILFRDGDRIVFPHNVSITIVP